MEKININNLDIISLNLENIDDILKLEKNLNIHIQSKDNIIKDLNNSKFKYFLVKYMDEIIAYSSISYTFDIEIEAIVVKKDFQRIGIATLLLNNIFEFAKSNNISNIFLEVRNSNFPAQELYLKNGFNQISIRKNYYYDNNENALVLKKTLTV